MTQHATTSAKHLKVIVHSQHMQLLTSNTDCELCCHGHQLLQILVFSAVITHHCPSLAPPSTLLHASLVLVPILGVTWALGFFVVGDSIYSTVVEWLFFAFSSLQGVFIFIMHCILNREVHGTCPSLIPRPHPHKSVGVWPGDEARPVPTAPPPPPPPPDFAFSQFTL